MFIPIEDARHGIAPLGRMLFITCKKLYLFQFTIIVALPAFEVSFSYSCLVDKLCDCGLGELSAVDQGTQKEVHGTMRHSADIADLQDF